MTRRWYEFRAQARGAAEIVIYDEIGVFGIPAKAFLDELKALGPVAELTLRINDVNCRPGSSPRRAIALSWTPAMVRRWHADPFGFLHPWNEYAPPPRLPRPAPAWSPS